MASTAHAFRLSRLWHGGDYNPDQWPESVWNDDLAAMQASGVTVVSLGIFSWAQLEPRDGEFAFDWLDRIMDRLAKAGIDVCLATPSAAHPRWLTRKHPEVQRVDEQRRRQPHGGRQRMCPSSPLFRQYLGRIEEALAKRYAGHPALKLWHISNEYGGGCWCDLCAARFRDWLKARYGDLDTLNRQWWGTFWSQAFGSWEEIEPPWAHVRTAWQGLRLDWRRFQSATILDLFRSEIASVRRHTPGLPVTTNLMGFYPGLDYAQVADLCDVVAWDSYPEPAGDPYAPSTAHAYMRGLKGNRPWLLMESSPSATNWQQTAPLKPPGRLALWSWQAVAQGSDSVMYFQWRRSRGAGEKFHGAVIEHSGSTDTRVFREVSALGANLARLSPRIIGTRVARARVGILHDQENRWALELTEGPGRDLDVLGVIHDVHRGLLSRNIAADIVRVDGDWSQYDILVAPMLYLVRSGAFPRQASPEELYGRIDVASRLDEFVRHGGDLVGTWMTGIVNESDLVDEGGYPGRLKSLFGILVEEIDHLAGRSLRIDATLPGLPTTGSGHRYADQIRLAGAEAIATYGESWYAGTPCATRHRHGSGTAWYLGTDPGRDGWADWMQAICATRAIGPLLPPCPQVEAVERTGDGRRLVFLLNHGTAPATQELGALHGTDLLTGAACAGSVALPGYGVRVIDLAG
jgi:beta-galactosidase